MHNKHIKIVTIVGARPQFIKAAAVSRAIIHHNNQHGGCQIDEILVHTGQHYDHYMNRVFFDELKMNTPDYNLGVGSGTHGDMTAKMLSLIEEVLLKESPNIVLVYGDTNSTLAGALAAAKLNIPVAHVEAGLRSYNKKMPEEINRVVADHLSSVLFAPTTAAAANLKKEGISDGVIEVGDVMYDAFLFQVDIARKQSTILQKLDLKPGSYHLATIHRQENTDDPDRLSNIFKAFDVIGDEKCPLVIPLHPRTRKALNRFNLEIFEDSRVRPIEPVGYLDMIQLESNARVIITDSGGVQKEAYYAGAPCVTLRNETEWIETIENGVNFLAGADIDKTVAAYKKALTVDVQLKHGIYGDGHAAEKIVAALISKN